MQVNAAGPEQTDTRASGERIEGRPVTTAQPYPSPALRWWTTAVLTILYAVSFVDRQVFALLIEPIRKSLGITDFQAGLLHGLAFSLFYATFGILCGWAVDRFRRRGIVFIGVVVWSIATSACGAVNSFAGLAVARFGVGAGEAALAPAANSMLSDTFPRARLATAISVFGSGPVIGSMAAMILASVLLLILPEQGVVLPWLGLIEPWRIVFIVAGLPGILLGLLVWTFPEPTRRARINEGRTSYAQTLGFMRKRWRFFVAHLGGVGLSAAAAYGYGTWVAVWLMREYDMSISQVGFILAAVNTIPGIIGVIAAGALTDWLFSRGVKDAHLRVMMVQGALQALAITIAVAMPHLFGAMAVIVILMLAFGSAGIAPAALQIVTPNDYRGQVTAIYGMVFMIVGFGIGPPLVGALATFALGDPALIGWAIAAAYWILTPIALLLFYWGLRPMREAVAEAEIWEAR